jgi:hypothetical protein
MNLVAKQSLFAQNISVLILWIHKQEGYICTLGEFHRPQWVAEIYQKTGQGSIHSNHIIRLAADLMIFLGGVYLKNSIDYRFAGEYWKSLHPYNRWGGDFEKPDGNHFSMEHEGMK